MACCVGQGITRQRGKLVIVHPPGMVVVPVIGVLATILKNFHISYISRKYARIVWGLYSVNPVPCPTYSGFHIIIAPHPR